jgi:hypothetical protein
MGWGNEFGPINPATPAHRRIGLPLRNHWHVGPLVSLYTRVPGFLSTHRRVAPPTCYCSSSLGQQARHSCCVMADFPLGADGAVTAHKIWGRDDRLAPQCASI